MEELVNEVFSATPVWTPKLQNTPTATFFQSPRFKELLNGGTRLRKNSAHPAVKSKGSGCVLRSPLLVCSMKGSPRMAHLAKRVYPRVCSLSRAAQTPNQVVRHSPILQLARASTSNCGSPMRNSPRLSLPSKKILQDKRPCLASATDPSRIKLTQLLGSGGFGSVYKGTIGGQHVAVKKFHATLKNQKARQQSFRAESNVLHLKHPNVVSVLASYCETGSDVSYIIMEYAGHVNLQQVVMMLDGAVDMARRLRYARDIAQALEYIHSRSLLHLDVKPSNIIISPHDVCRLADFGCCQMVEGDTGCVSPTLRSYLTGTVAYRAPEVLYGHPPCRKADIYSLGVTMWQMVANDTPFAGENPHVVIFGVVSQNARPCTPVEHADQGDPAEVGYEELYKQCWAPSQSARPTAEQLIQVFNGWLSNGQPPTQFPADP